jgi:hypothetical protein
LVNVGQEEEQIRKVPVVSWVVYQMTLRKNSEGMIRANRVGRYGVESARLSPAHSGRRGERGRSGEVGKERADPENLMAPPRNGLSVQ